MTLEELRAALMDHLNYLIPRIHAEEIRHIIRITGDQSRYVTYGQLVVRNPAKRPLLRKGGKR